MPLTWKGEIEFRWDAQYQDKLVEDLKQKIKSFEVEVYSLNGKLTKNNTLLRKSKSSQADLQEYINRLKIQHEEEIEKLKQESADKLAKASLDL